MTKHIQVCREPGLARDTVGGCSKAGVNTENPGHQATSRGGPVHHLHPPPISRCRVLVCGAHSRSTRNCRHAAYVHTGACVYMQIQGGSWNITPVPQVHAQGCTPYKDVCAHIWPSGHATHTHTHLCTRRKTRPQPSLLHLLVNGTPRPPWPSATSSVKL